MNPLLHWLTSPEWTQLVTALLHSLWQGALLAGALALLMRRLTQPRFRYYAALSALTILVLASPITWAVLNAPPALAPNPPTPVISESFFPSPADPPPSFADADKVVVIGTRTTPAPAPIHWTAWLALVWMIGAGLMLLRAGLKVAGAEKLRRSCRPLTDETMTLLVVEACRAINLARKIRVAITDQLTSPAVVGVLVPTLILPLSLFTTLTPEQIRFVLLHELAHIRRGDYFANLFQLLAEALLFFNPAVWWLSHLIRREREACCDALAIERSGAPADYAKTLVRVAENILPPAPTTALAFGEPDREPSSLADRVQRLLVPGYRPSLRLTWRAMLAAICIGGVLLFLSAIGTRNVVGAVSSNLTGTATNPATNVTEIFSASGDLTYASFTPPRWEGSWKPKSQELKNGDFTARVWAPTSEEVLAVLEQIKFDRVFFRNRKLSEVLPELEKALLATDPAKFGFRLFLPPDWAYPGKRDGIESVVINMPTELRDTTLRTVLDAIVSNASGPIQYHLGGLSANFEMQFDAPPNMWFRRFNVYGKTFLPFIGVDESMAAPDFQERNGGSPDPLGEAIKKRFLQAGVDLRPPNWVLYKPGADLLYVHAGKKEDLDAVEELLKNLSQEGGEARRKSPSQASDESKSSTPQFTLHKPTIQAIGQVSSALPRDIEISSVPAIGMPSSALSGYLAQDGFLLHPPATGIANWVLVTNGHLKKQWFYYRIGKVGEVQPVPVKNRQAILNKLDSLRLNNYDCFQLPLKEVLRRLTDKSQQIDPEKVGINFVVAGYQDSSNSLSDIESVPITVDLGASEASLGSILYYIVKGAETPIEYSILDDVVMFHWKATTSGQPNNPKPPTRAPFSPPLDKVTFGRDEPLLGYHFSTESWKTSKQEFGPVYTTNANQSFGLDDWTVRGGNLDRQDPTARQWFWHRAGASQTSTQAVSQLSERSFNIDPVALSAAAGKSAGFSAPATQTNLGPAIREFFHQSGVDLDPAAGKSYYLNLTKGLLWVRATAEELDKIEAVVSGLNTPPLTTQTFQVNPIGIASAVKDLAGKFPALAAATNNPSTEMRALLEILGVKLEPPKSLLYNQEGGALFVRATPSDLKSIEEILQVIGTQPPQVHIKTLFVEADDDLTTLLRDLSSGTNQNLNSAISLAATPSILSPEQLESFLKTLKEKHNAEIMSAPRVTTLSGRQAQVQMVNMRTIATGITGVVSNGVTNLVVQTEARPFGPVLDVMPVVADDRINIQLTLIPSFTEFIGYDHAATFVPTPPSTNNLPLPIFRVRQITTSVVVKDGQTVLLSGFSDRMSRTTTGNKSVEKLLRNGRQMLVFVTPLIIDQAGNPANQDIDSTSKQLPPQPR